jgi:hypothetical protein
MSFSSSEANYSSKMYNFARALIPGASQSESDSSVAVKFLKFITVPGEYIF